MNIETIATTTVDKLDIDALPEKTLSYWYINMITNGLGEMMQIPVMAIRGKQRDPVVGITAATHGNELNGLPVIYKLFNELNPKKLKGTIVALPVVNIPGFLSHTRYFRDRSDLNRLFPGKVDGIVGEQYAYQFIHKVVVQFQYLIDLHTASFGRINSLYVRTDLSSEITAKMAYLQRPQIVVHNYTEDKTLRAAASQMEIPAITVELGNPSIFQKRLIQSSLIGLRNVLSYLKMVPKPEKLPKTKPVICSHSYWIRTDKGGILEVLPDITHTVEKGEVIAILRNIFGKTICKYKAPEVGIVIGKSTNPVADTGARILHLGIIDQGRFT